MVADSNAASWEASLQLLMNLANQPFGVATRNKDIWLESSIGSQHADTLEWVVRLQLDQPLIELFL